MLLSVNSHTIGAVYKGFGVYADSSTELTHVVSQAATSTSLAANTFSTQFVIGDLVSLTATVKPLNMPSFSIVNQVAPPTGSATVPPTGTMTLFDADRGFLVLDTETLIDGFAELNAAGLSGGHHNLVVSYGGDAKWGPPVPCR